MIKAGEEERQGKVNGKTLKKIWRAKQKMKEKNTTEKVSDHQCSGRQ